MSVVTTGVFNTCTVYVSLFAHQLTPIRISDIFNSSSFLSVFNYFCYCLLTVWW